MDIIVNIIVNYLYCEVLIDIKNDEKNIYVLVRKVVRDLVFGLNNKKRISLYYV